MLWLALDKAAPIPLTRQICDQLRAKILTRELPAGEQLPATRKLAQDLHISRNVVIYAYEQLISEGYLESREGSGTYVAEGIYLETYQYDNCSEQALRSWPRSVPIAPDIIDFQSGLPDLRQFPRKIWGKLMRDVCLDAPEATFDYPPTEGIWELRQALTQFLLKTKGIRCHPDQILIVSGSAQGLAIVFQVLAAPHQHFIIEDPLYSEIPRTLTTLNYTFTPVPVDEKGMQVDFLQKQPDASGIIVTPSHQFPMGSVLPVQRRVKLIEYAQATGTYIIENDYDSEFRYVGAPISSLHLLRPDRVLHVGTFSESLYPAVRLGYLVIPEPLIDACRHLKSALGLVTSSFPQLTLKQFITTGEFEHHLNKMKKLYREKRVVLSGQLSQAFGDNVHITGDSTGLYIVAVFDRLEFTAQLLEDLEQDGVRVYRVEDHAFVKGQHRNKIILGYGNLSLAEIITGVDRLKQVLLHVYQQ